MKKLLLSLMFVLASSIPVLAGVSQYSHPMTTVDLPSTGQVDCYDTSGNSISCTNTGQDGDIKAGVSTFGSWTLNGNQTATNLVTNIVWTTDAYTPGPAECGSNVGVSLNQQQALDYIKCLNNHQYLGFTDWTLPNANQLQSLTNRDPAILPRLASNVQPTSYWTSTSFASSPDKAWVVSMVTGASDVASKTTTHPVWPMRTPVNLVGTWLQAWRGIWGAGSANTGDSVTIAAAFKNIGGPAKFNANYYNGNAGVQYCFYLSPSTEVYYRFTPTAADVAIKDEDGVNPLVGSVSTLPLPAGGEQFIYAKGKIPVVPTGYYYVYAVTDCGNGIDNKANAVNNFVNTQYQLYVVNPN